MLSREVATDIQTLERLARALGKNLPILQPASEQALPEGQGSTATAPRLPQPEGSGRQERAGQAGGETYPGASGAKRASSPVALETSPPLPPGSSAWGSLLAVLARLPTEVQRDIAVRAVRQGIEAQELHGSGLLRAMVSICAALDELGYAAMAREIRSELLKAMAEDLAREKPEKP